jgi:hypothetical protein
VGQVWLKEHGDATTLATGDAGSRLACGEVR